MLSVQFGAVQKEAGFIMCIISIAKGYAVDAGNADGVDLDSLK